MPAVVSGGLLLIGAWLLFEAFTGGWRAAAPDDPAERSEHPFYAAGFLWATLNGRGPQTAVDTGAAVAALKCSTWGDIALIDAHDVADLLAGGSDIRR